MIHPNTELRHINPQVGYGVFATAFIPEGTIVYIKDSLEIEVSPEEYLKHSKEVQEQIEKYSYIDEKGYRIISWDFAKYVNHCCNCNTISTGYGFEIAIRDIYPGEQITDEYGIFNLENPIKLLCNESICRKEVKPEDFDLYYPVWDEKIKQALSKFFYVDQPLQGFIDTGTHKQLMDYFQDSQKYKSVYTLRNKELVEVPNNLKKSKIIKSNGHLTNDLEMTE